MRELVTLLADALRTDLARVNALAGDVPALGGETVDVGTVATVYDSASTGWAARGEIPTEGVTTPCWVVRLVEPASYVLPANTAADGHWNLSATPSVAVQYLDRDVDTVAALARGARQLRAIRAWVWDVHNRPQTGRTLGAVELVMVTGLRVADLYHDNDADAVTGAALLDCSTREILPALPSL